MFVNFHIFNNCQIYTLKIKTNMKIFLVFCLLIFLVSTKKSQLLQMSQKSSCIKDIINDFVDQNDCHNLLDDVKTKIAIKMTNCLNLKLGKKKIQNCQDINHCQITGDNWNTFTNFFTHIDNLCHFYWQVLHHQKTQALMKSLTSSALLSEGILRQNVNQTKKILSMQEVIQKSMIESLSQQKQLADMLNFSQQKISNLTNDVQQFVKKIQNDIELHYASVASALTTIDQGINNLNSFQKVMISQISSVQGMIYYLCLTLAILLLTTIKYLNEKRSICLLTILINVFCEILIPNSLIFIIGCKTLRYAFVLVLILILFKPQIRTQESFLALKMKIDQKLETVRIKRLFYEMAKQQKVLKNE